MVISHQCSFVVLTPNLCVKNHSRQISADKTVIFRTTIWFCLVVFFGCAKCKTIVKIWWPVCSPWNSPTVCWIVRSSAKIWTNTKRNWRKLVNKSNGLSKRWRICWRRQKVSFVHRIISLNISLFCLFESNCLAI